MPKELLSLENPTEEESASDNSNEKIQLSCEQRLQLEEQIRKFVQLLTQMYLLSRREKELSLNESSKQILRELAHLASENSIFNACNLNGALNIIKDFDIKKDASFKFPKGIPFIVRRTIVNSEVFMYPELLPICGFTRGRGRQKVTFTKAEDNLIALGLERFSDEYSPLHQIQQHYLPCKKISQIKFRIKNLKASKAPKDNPIKYYYTHKEAPPIPRNVQIFDPNKVKAPKDLPSADLPDWIISSTSKYRLKPMETIDKPLFILPKGIIIQNGNLSVVTEQFSMDNIITFENDKLIIAKRKKLKPLVVRNSVQKPPFILPKGTIRKDKELSSNATNLPDLESLTNSNAESNNDTLDKIVANESIKPKSKSKKRSVLDNFIIKPLCMVDDKNKTFNSNSSTMSNIDKPKRNFATKLSSPKKQKFSMTDDYLPDLESNNDALDKIVANESIKPKGKSKKRCVLDNFIIKPLCMVDDKNKTVNSNSSTMLNMDKPKKNYARKLSNDEDCIVSPKKQKFSVTDDHLPDLESLTNSNAKSNNGALHKIVANESIKSKGKSKKRSALDKVIIKHLCMVDDKNNENKTFNSNSSTILNMDKPPKNCARKLSNDEDHIVSPNKEKVSVTDDHLPGSIFKENDVVIESEIVDGNSEPVVNAFIMDSISPVSSNSSFYSVNKNNAVQMHQKIFEECKMNHYCNKDITSNSKVNKTYSNISVNQKRDSLKNAKSLKSLVDEKNTLIENPLKKNNVNFIEKKDCKSLINAYIDDANSNKSSDLQTATSRFKQNEKYKIKKSKYFNNTKDKISNVQKNKCSLSEQNHRNVDELCIALRNGKFVQNVNNSTFSYENKNKISETNYETPENVNQTLLSSNNVVTKSIEYITDPIREGSNIIIKSEVTEEICSSSQDAWLSNCELTIETNSNFLDDDISKQNSNLDESKIKNKATSITKVLSENIPSVINQSPDESDTLFETLKNVNKTLSSANSIDTKSTEFSVDSIEKDCGIVIKSEVLEEMCDPPQKEFLMDNKGTISNSMLLNKCINKNNSTFEYGDKKKYIKNAITFSETTEMFDVCHIKQEIKDDSEDAQTYESVHKFDKCNTFTEMVINDKPDIKCTENSKQVMKTIDYLPNSTDKECGIIIKSEFVEESNEASEDACKIDFYQTKTLSSTAENYNSSSRKRNLRSTNQISFTKKNAILRDNFDIRCEFLKSAKTAFIGDNACREKVPIKLEIIHDDETSLQNTSDTMCNKPVLKTTKNIIKSNSLEKAHLKRSSRIKNQKRKNQNCQTKKRKNRKKI